MIQNKGKDFIRIDLVLYTSMVSCSNLLDRKAFYSVVNILYVDLLETDAK